MFSILADVVVLIYLGIYGFYGFRRGFVVSVLKFVTGFLAFLAAFALVQPVVNFLQNVGMYTVLSDFFTDTFHLADMSNAFTDTVGSWFGGLFGNFLNNIATSGGILSFDSFGGMLVGFIINVLLFLVLYCICLIVIKAIAKLLDQLASLPVLNFLNRVLGVLFGAVKGFAILYLVVGILFIFVPTENRIHVDQAIGGSKSFEHIIQNNYITQLFEENTFYNPF